MIGKIIILIMVFLIGTFFGSIILNLIIEWFKASI